METCGSPRISNSTRDRPLELSQIKRSRHELGWLPAKSREVVSPEYAFLLRISHPRTDLCHTVDSAVLATRTAPWPQFRST
jgi:hypothetical protein